MAAGNGLFRECLQAISCETRNITFLLMDERVKTAGQLFDEFMEASGHVYPFALNAVRGHAESLSKPSRLARAEHFRYPGGRMGAGYKATEEGLEFGHPIASNALAKSCETGIPMSGVFGRSIQAETPYKVFSILRRLEKGSCSLTEISDETRTDISGVRIHMERMEHSGLLTCDSPGRDGILYTRTGFIIPPSRSRRLRKAVVEYLNRFGSGTASRIAEYLSANYGYKPGVFLSTRVSNSLAYLSGLGFCSGKYSSKRRSQASLTGEGRAIAEYLLLSQEFIGGYGKMDEGNWREHAPDSLELHLKRKLPGRYLQ